MNLHRNEVDIVKIMTFESSGSENHITTSPPDEALETNPRVSEPEKTRQNDINIEKKNENVVSSPEHDGATCNGYSSVGHNTKNAPPNSSSNLNNLRKTLAKWLRPKNKSKKPTQRSRLMGWPPRWVRDQPESNNSNQRALPPVPSSQTESNRADHIPDEDERVSTPELRPEDFPPGVAYLPDGDDVEEPLEFGSKSNIIDFTASIEAVKNCDWYWGPICGSAAEQVLSTEPDGSFLVRDSSDDRYIFSLTFKLNGTVRHVRIEHDQGNFSFGSFTRFKSNTIVDFVQNAVEHSRSGRYLFFLNRRPTNGPMRVQLLHPVSRVKQVQSLQHMCRFVILKLVPRDHVDQLPVPKRIMDYLKTPNYYSENIEDHPEKEEEQNENQIVTSQETSEVANVDENAVYE